MNTKIKITIVVVVIAWVYSLFWVWSNTRKECANIAYRKALDAYRDGKSESRTEIDDSPYIQRSVWTTEYLSFDVRDTYFAHGSDLQTNLEILALSEGFFPRYYKDGPRAHITVDGSDEHVKVSIMIDRTLCFNVSSYLSLDSNHSIGDNHWYDIGRYVKDLFVIYSHYNYFPAKTSYNEVESWVNSVFKSIFLEIKQNNIKTFHGLREHPKKERKKEIDDKELFYLWFMLWR